MGYFTIIYIFLYLVITACEVSSITTRIDHQPVRNFRRHTGPPPFTDWELGLREAVHQALLREHHTDPTLREQLLEAPLLGRQNNASPFGDIAVLARGQLYITADGFKFVQDSDQDDCDCHNPRCVASPQCQIWTRLGHHQKLLALWTVKRIRHRDPHHGHVFEIEYTISPITSAISEELVRRHGYFNYNVPGHIFVVRSDPRLNSAYYLNGNDDKWYKKQQTVDEHRDHKEHGSGHFKPGILIGVSPDGYQHVLHSFPGFYSSYHNDQTTIDPKEYELYKKLIESLAAKTSNVPHRFSVTTEKTTNSGVLTTTFVPVPQTTLVQVLQGQLVPLTENTLQPTTTFVKFPTTSPAQVTKYSEPDQFYHTTTIRVPTLESPKPITVPVTTTLHYYTPFEGTSRPSTATTSKKVVATTSKGSKKPTTLQEIDNFDIFTTQPVRKTTRKSSTVSQKTTQAVTTEAEQVELFPFNTSTEPMKQVTESPNRTSPDSVNEQLPPPDKETDTTIPYISSTVTQASTPKIKTTAMTAKNTKVPTTTQKVSSTLVPSAREEITTVIEKIPYTEEKTTVILPIPSTQQVRTTPLSRTTEQARTTTIDKIYTLTATSPVTEEKITSRPQTTTFVGVPSIPGTTIFDRGTTQIFGSVETVPTTISNPTTQATTVYTKPTTLFEYSFDSTSRSNTETFSSTTNTLPTTTRHFPSTETIKYTIPTTTAHYYYTFETDVPKTTIVATETTALTPTMNIKSTHQNEENTISTQQTTPRTTKQQNIFTTTTNDFLVDSEIDANTNTILDSRKDFDEDDIFGKEPTKMTTPFPETTTKRVFQSDLDRALFGGRRSKQIKLSSKITVRPSVANTTRIIYSNFYAPPTQTTFTRKGFVETTTSFEGATEFRPSTDQSYSTSISFEVNKKKSTKPTNVLESTMKANVREVGNSPNFKVYKKALQRSSEALKSTTQSSQSETKKVLDDAAQQLVNHARTIDYLHKKPSRQPKYRRRSYTTRRSHRRSTANDNSNRK